MFYVNIQYMNTHELHQDVVRIALASCEYWHQALKHSQAVCSMSGKTDYVGVTNMERLDQGHLHPLLKDPSNQEQQSSKELFEQLIKSYSEHLHELATL